MFLDIQTLINLKESLPNELLEGWADRIAHWLKATIAERMEEDPANYQRFSKLVQQAIDEYRAQRISEQEYFERVKLLDDQVQSYTAEDMPVKLQVP